MRWGRRLKSPKVRHKFLLALLLAGREAALRVLHQRQRTRWKLGSPPETEQRYKHLFCLFACRCQCGIANLYRFNENSVHVETICSPLHQWSQRLRIHAQGYFEKCMVRVRNHSSVFEISWEAQIKSPFQRPWMDPHAQPYVPPASLSLSSLDEGANLLQHGGSDISRFRCSCSVCWAGTTYSVSTTGYISNQACHPLFC